MNLFILTLVVLVLRASTSKLSGTLNEIEFPPSWHFFENHHSLESYKYGLLMQTLVHLKSKRESTREIFSNVMSYDIESISCEVYEDVFCLISSPVLFIENQPSSRKTNNVQKVYFCSERSNKCLYTEKRKVAIQTLKLNLADGSSIKLLLSFSRVGMWIWDGRAIMKNKPSRYSNSCYVVGTKDKVGILQKSLHSKIKISEVPIDVPFFKSKIISDNFYDFITENKIDGVVGLNDNSIQGVGVFETISNVLEPPIGKYLISFECNKDVNVDQARNSLSLAVLSDNVGTLMNDEVNHFVVKLIVDGEAASEFSAKLTLNLNIFGIVIPEFRLLQIYKVLNRIAIQKGYGCEIRNAVLGRAIFCDCDFLGSHLSLRILDRDSLYSINLSNLVALDTNKEKRCMIEIYGRKGGGIKFEDRWIFGQILCKASNINQLSKVNQFNWKIGSPQLIKK
ncbi:putative signal peptide-containing secreted protein [Cryptosporidium canis]|uniref:Signal peptide-containing secreted protein n=1 Tax=Cryptosporidium canis TaxID=195482 RepID=A0ABQ8PC44_9CRYT|nr:putative signal peptide-containing secreted protein [Cryptosporidium canis]KAJ1613217.1 putative signal peptide-containing secreted protein [Cryptosporidium canis]